MKLLSRTENYTLKIAESIAACADKDTDYYIGEPLTNDNLTDFFTALLCAYMVILNKTTGQKHDLLDTIAMANKLAFQYIKTSDEENSN